MSEKYDDPEAYDELVSRIALSALAYLAADQRDNRARHGLLSYVARTIIRDYPQAKAGDPYGTLLTDALLKLVQLHEGIAAAYARDKPTFERLTDLRAALVDASRAEVEEP